MPKTTSEILKECIDRLKKTEKPTLAFAKNKAKKRGNNWRAKDDVHAPLMPKEFARSSKSVENLGSDSKLGVDSVRLFITEVLQLVINNFPEDSAADDFNKIRNEAIIFLYDFLIYSEDIAVRLIARDTLAELLDIAHHKAFQFAKLLDQPSVNGVKYAANYIGEQIEKTIQGEVQYGDGIIAEPANKPLSADRIIADTRAEAYKGLHAAARDQNAAGSTSDKYFFY